MGKEERKFLRFECLVPVDSIRLEGESSPVEGPRLENVSREGAKIVLNLDLDVKPGELLEFRFSVPDGKISSVVRGEIVWSRAAEGKLEVGLKLKDVDSITRSELLELGYSRWKEDKPPGESGPE